MSKDQVDVENWLAIRKREGLEIDPANAEVHWVYAQTLDPYGVQPDLPEECRQVGREFFARRPGSNIWVSFRDLPDNTRKRLLEKHGSKLYFPAGLEPVFAFLRLEDVLKTDELDQPIEKALLALSNGTFLTGCSTCSDGFVFRRYAN